MKTVSLPIKTELLISAVCYIDRQTGKMYYDDLGLRYIKGNQDSYFTIDLGSKKIAKLIGADNFKKAEQLIEPLHLSNSRGEPLHVNSNGFYYVEMAQGVAKYHDKGENDLVKYTKVLSKHLRISLEQAAHIIETVKTVDEFKAITDSMRARWEDEAQTAIEFLESIKHLSEK